MRTRDLRFFVHSYRSVCQYAGRRTRSMDFAINRLASLQGSLEVSNQDFILFRRHQDCEFLLDTVGISTH